jgi:hypothetical protein
MITFYCFRFECPQPGGQVPVFISPRNRVAQLFPQAPGSLSVAFYDSQVYCGGDLNPAPHPGGPVCYALKHKFEVDRIQNTAPNSTSTFCFRIRCRAGMYWSSRVSCHDRRWVGQSAPEQSTHLGPKTRLTPLLDRGGHADAGRPPFPTRGRVLRPQPLPDLVSAVTLGSESRGTRDHTPPSQIRNFSLHRLPRLTGQRWRHSTPPPHRSSIVMPIIVLSYRACMWHYYLCIICRVWSQRAQQIFEVLICALHWSKPVYQLYIFVYLINCSCC